MQTCEVRCSKWLKEQVEARDLEARSLAEVEWSNEQPPVQTLSREDNLTVGQALATGDQLPGGGDSSNALLHTCIRRGYVQDTLFVEILNKLPEHPCFVIKQGLVYMMSPMGLKVLCVPHERLLITTILEQAHTIVGHFEYQKTLNYMCRFYWWPQMAKGTRVCMEVQRVLAGPHNAIVVQQSWVPGDGQPNGRARGSSIGGALSDSVALSAREGGWDLCPAHN
ncbi:hypothetical protein C0993_007506, partial [Termitomyces sp. T159_Od127]